MRSTSFLLLCVSVALATRIYTKAAKYGPSNIKNGTDVKLNFDTVIADETHSYLDGSIIIKSRGIYKVGITVSWTAMGMEVDCQVKIKDISGNVIAYSGQRMHTGVELVQTIELATFQESNRVSFWIQHNAPTTILVPATDTPVMVWTELEY